MMFKTEMNDIASEHIKYLKSKDVSSEDAYEMITGRNLPFGLGWGAVRDRIINWYKENNLIRQAGIVSCEGIGKHWRSK